MKKISFILVGLFFTSTLIAQSNYQSEMICPCLLEFKFPKTIGDGETLAQGFGGIPVLRFAEAKIDGNKLICEYETAFAKFRFDGFGFTWGSGNLSEIPYELELTLSTSHLYGWIPSRKTVKLQAYHRGCVIYLLDRCGDDTFSWDGGFYKSEYKDKQITLYRKFNNEARVNSAGIGFIIADTKTGLYTPMQNTEEISNPAIKGKKKPVKIQKKKPVKKLPKKRIK